MANRSETTDAARLAEGAPASAPNQPRSRFAHSRRLVPVDQTGTGYIFERSMYRIETPNLLLRPFDESDFDAVHDYGSDPNVTRYQGWGPNSEADTRSFIQRSIRAMQTPESGEIVFAIVEQASSRLVGGCGLTVRGRQSRVFEIGYTLNPNFWRRGIGSEAVEHLMAFAFDTLAAHRIFALIDPENRASIALIERLGFRLEGHQKSDTLIRGEWRDTLVYAVLESER